MRGAGGRTSKEAGLISKARLLSVAKKIVVIAVVSGFFLLAVVSGSIPESNRTMENLLTAVDKQTRLAAEKKSNEERLEQLRIDAEKLAAETERLRIEAEAALAVERELTRINRVRFPINPGWYLTGDFGNRCDVAGAYSGCAVHTGMDFGVSNQTGWNTYPVAKGAVVGVFHFDGPWQSCGNYIAVWHEELGFTSLYCHLAATYVNTGDLVDPDTPLGEIGTTGMSNGIHLHLGFYSGTNFWTNDSVFDPRPWLEQNGLI